MGTYIARRLLHAAIIMLGLAVFSGLALLSNVLGVNVLGDALDVRWGR